MAQVTPRRLFVFWTGGEPLSPARRLSLALLRLRSGVDVTLINNDNLSHWVVEESPLHPAYLGLSSTHKSDYLRAYFMVHHAGGYADIKPLTFDWRPHFAHLDRSGADFNGYPESSPGHIAGGPETRTRWSELAGCGYYIFRPMSPVAAERLRCIHDVLDDKLSLILSNPGTYHPRATIEGVHDPEANRTQGPRGYPLRWTEIGGEIFHPLQCRYPKSFIRTMPRVRVGRWYR